MKHGSLGRQPAQCDGVFAVQEDKMVLGWEAAWEKDQPHHSLTAICLFKRTFRQQKIALNLPSVAIHRTHNEARSRTI
jgi:hypothetical protein